MGKLEGDGLPIPDSLAFAGRSGVRFADDADVVAYDRRADDWFPRTDQDGNPLHSWARFHQKAIDHIERDLRGRRTYAEPFDLGRIGERSRRHLRDAHIALVLHFMCVEADTQGDVNGFYSRTGMYYLRMAKGVIDTESVALDYDEANDGTVGEGEKQRPIVTMFLRG